ncbi:MAG: hypothetical protein ACM3TR_11015 [Caulobacteraceae bacterium]
MPQNNIVSFNSIIVNAININSGIFVGTNNQSTWKSSNNIKAGFGAVAGNYNVVSRATNFFTDNDLMDTPMINYNYFIDKEALENKEEKAGTESKPDKGTIIKLSGRHKEFRG